MRMGGKKMSCCDNLKKNSNKEAILIGEVGALLHDIGKAHPSFIKKHAVDCGKSGLPHHARGIGDILSPRLLGCLKNDRLKVKLSNKGKADEKTVYDFICFHHPERDEEVKSVLLECLISCDRKDTADDKGIVRRKQSVENTVISSPFGSPKEVIDLDLLQERFNKLDNDLSEVVERYISCMDLIEFRNSVMRILRDTFSHALGETRIPANDVTLWDHSYSTASLFKSALAGKVIGEEPTGRWRLFGVNWNGWEFLERGRKIAEIQRRSEIIEEIKIELRKQFEDELPVGNAVYEDTNGIYFTFPGVDLPKAKELAEECAREALKVIYRKSDDELWPFFTLSKAAGALTIIAGELKFAAQKRKVPRMTPVLFVEDREEEFFENPPIKAPEVGQDICPICRLRPKDEGGGRIECNVCRERRRGRLSGWLDSRKDTIWIEEAADKNNRIALLTLSFNLEKWLDGTLIGTVCSQTFEDWLSKDEKDKLSKVLDNLKEILKEQIEKVNKALEGMKQAKDPSKVRKSIEEKMKVREAIERRKKELEFDLEPSKDTVYRILDTFFKAKDSKEEREKKCAVELLKTFFEENIGLNVNNLEERLNNIKERSGEDELTKEILAAQLFTQNPSPARLYRVWREAEEFFNLVGEEIKKRIYADCWKRIGFSVDPAAAEKYDLRKNTPYILRINGLEPETLLVLHTENGNFYTIESLEKYKYNSKIGEEAVIEALGEGLCYLALEDKPQKNLLEAETVSISKETAVEEYYPFIEINKSPLSLCLIVPASDSVKIAELAVDLYGKKFENAVGKLPLSVKLLVANRKFPLYVLLDAESRMLEGDEFKKQTLMNPWWNVAGSRVDEHYGFYPVKLRNRYTLDDISPASRGKIFALFPGYFDFDLLLGTVDRYSIAYKGDGERENEGYRLFSGRPYYFYQIAELRELWELLSQNLSASQIHFIEEVLTLKLWEWRKVERGNKQSLFKKFAEATLRDAFGEKWESLREETRHFLVYSAVNGLLLDAVSLFGHVIKEKEVG